MVGQQAIKSIELRCQGSDGSCKSSQNFGLTLVMAVCSSFTCKTTISHIQSQSEGLTD